MSIFRLLAFSLVIAAGVATLAAQSSPEKNPAATIQSGDYGQISSSSRVDLLSPNLKAEPNLRNPINRILVGDYRPHLSQFSVPQALLQMGSDLPMPSDTACLKMRVYKVARDSPNTDSMHPVSYTTCSPAARFVLHTTEYRVPAATP
jgi:hypothetical protein